jgi:hypothetical protein
VLDPQCVLQEQVRVRVHRVRAIGRQEEALCPRARYSVVGRLVVKPCVRDAQARPQHGRKVVRAEGEAAQCSPRSGAFPEFVVLHSAPHQARQLGARRIRASQVVRRLEHFGERSHLEGKLGRTAERHEVPARAGH